ncbi:MAG: RNA polymerase sporulation sigma factor SigH [Nitriliruptor sp.]
MALARGAITERDVHVQSDEQLVGLVHAGDDRAMTELLQRYRGFARSKARSYFLAGGDREDTAQEGMIGLYKAVRDYAPGHGASFRSFAELCITRQILTAVKTATRQKHGPLNSYVSFDRPHDGDPDRTIGDTVAAEDDLDPLAQVVASEELRRLQRAFDEVLSGLETEVLTLYVEGRSYQEIAGLLGRRVKSIDNALQRIKRKLEPHVGDAAADQDRPPVLGTGANVGD